VFYSFNPYYLLILPFLWVPFYVFNSFLWYILMKKQKINVGFPYVFKLSLIGEFYGLITIGGLGRYILPFYLKEKSGDSLLKCTANLLINEATGSIALLICAMIGTVVLAEYFAYLLPVLILLFIILITLCIVFIYERTGKKIVKIFINTFTPRKLKKNMSFSIDMLYKDFPSKKFIIFLVFMELIFWLMYFSEAFIVAKMLMIDIPYLYFILIYPIGVIIASIPISIGGVGIREGSLIPIFLSFGVVPEKIFVLSLIFSIFTAWIVPASIGAILSVSEIKLKNVN
ncbi:MAG TPA: lysylphosphatidylglycerol synthase transmembrane domain-containing protein, partial [Candidatus Lokiarchaeia archaeon]